MSGRSKNHTLKSGTSLYSLGMGVPPPGFPRHSKLVLTVNFLFLSRHITQYDVCKGPTQGVKETINAFSRGYLILKSTKIIIISLFVDEAFLNVKAVSSGLERPLPNFLPDGLNPIFVSIKPTWMSSPLGYSLFY